MAQTSGGALVASILAGAGVEKIFGIPDGTYLSLIKNAVEAGLELITPRHETTAAHMAGAYSRISGKLGVCLASNGPGVANVLPGVAVEQAEGNRVLLITSCRRTQIAYPDRGGTYQYLDHVGVIRPMAKWSACATRIDRVPELLRKALAKSYEGRPGVVHLDIPENIINHKNKGEGAVVPALHRYRTLEPMHPAPELVARSAKMLTDSRLPCIHAGSGVIHSSAFDELVQLAEMLHAPVTTSWSGRGVLPETHPLSWPMIHVKACKQVHNTADTVLCLGTRLGETDWWGRPPAWRTPEAQKMIQVDIDPGAMGLNKTADLPVMADIRIFLSRLLDRLKQGSEAGAAAERRAAVSRLAKDRDRHRKKLDNKLKDTGSPLLTGHLARVCRRMFNDDAIAVFDGGNTAVWGNFYHQVRMPNTQLSTHHFGHLGAGLGQALGAAVAKPGTPVYCIIGDGAFGFHPQEVETAVRNRLPVIFLVACDRQWGMVKMTQQMAFKPVKTMIKKSLGSEETINADLGEIRFDLLAQAMGAHGERVSSLEELAPAIERSLDSKTCAVIHVDVDPVKHMWAPGLMHFKDMHQEPSGQ